MILVTRGPCLCKCDVCSICTSSIPVGEESHDNASTCSYASTIACEADVELAAARRSVRCANLCVCVCVCRCVRERVRERVHTHVRMLMRCTSVRARIDMCACV